LDVQVVEFLSVNSTADRIAKEVINDDCNQTIVIVGHQPNLGYLITKLLGLNERASVVKKGAVWWLRQRSLENGQENALQTYLFTVQHPSHLV
jgi:phosphohistidine phosphatase